MKRMRSQNKLLFLILLAAMALASPALAQKQALLLYKSSEEASPTVSRLAMKVDPILRQLGYQTTYHDVDKGLPGFTNADLVVTWFSTPKIADPEAYVDWMAAQIAAGRKVIVLGNFGAHTSDGSTWMTDESLNRFFYPFGLTYKAAYSGDTNLLRITKQELPAKQPVPVNYYLWFESANAENQVYLEVERTDLAGSNSALVVKTPYGGMAQEVYVDNLDLAAFIKAIVTSEKRMAATKQKLLGLYKSSEGVNEHNNYLARFVAPTLYDLGYGIDYYDIEQGLPSEAKMGGYAGVISWYITPELAKAADYINWLAAQNDAGRRVIILGNFGAFAEDIESSAGTVRRFLQSPEYNRFFYPFGLEFRGAWTPEKKSVKVEKRDPEVITWLEPGQVGHYYWIRSVHPDNKEFLTVTRSDLEDGESAVVVATPKGGLALESYVLTTDPATNLPRMHIDLKKFLSAALTLQSTTAGPLKPNLEALKAKPPLAIMPRPEPEGFGSYPADVKPIKRRVLAFYQSSIDETTKLNAVFLTSQMILEHMGLIVEYHDLDSGELPSMQEMEKYRGIVMALSGVNVPNAQAFDQWLRDNIQAGRKFALIGDYHIRDKDTLSLVSPQPLYKMLGLHYDPIGNAPFLVDRRGAGFKQAAKTAHVVYKRPGVMDFEAGIDFKDKDLQTSWHLVKSIGPENEVGLTVEHGGGRSDIVVHSPKGSVALGPFAIFDQDNVRRLREEIAAKEREHQSKAQAEEVGGDPWRLDPFKFFGRALQVDGLPRPDFTTLNGSRIYYSHIDGDAFGGISLIDRSSINGEMMLKRVLRPLPLPITISYVTRDVESRLDEKYSRELEVAREIFRLPNVEAASHTFSHPFDWQKGDLALAGDGSYELYRKDIDLRKQISHSLEFVDKLCPPGKRCRILLWSGRCNPKEEAIKLVREKGLLNMNGAESTLDSKFPYIAGLLPLYGQVGDETQYHVSAAGDFYYTSSWTGAYDGMKELPDYFNRTESPRRLRCLNVYFHFYLAERQPGIDGLKVAFEDVLKRSPAPMFASEYIELLRDTLETKMGVDQQGRYFMRNRGEDATMRFDQTNAYPDMDKSQGVIGFNRANGDLYVHLDGTGEARVALTDQAPAGPYLVRYTQRISNWSISKDAVSFTSYGQGPAYLELANLSPSSSYRIETTSGERTVRTDASGTLTWSGRFDGYRKSHPFSIRKVSK